MTKNKIILCLTAFSLIFMYLYFSKDNEVKEVVKTVVKYDTIFKTIDNTKPIEIKEVTIKIPYKVTDTIYKDLPLTIKTKRHVYIDSLANGVINSVIFSDKIYKRNVSLKTFNKETTTTIEKIIVKSNLFVGASTSFNFNQSINNITIDGYYIHKNKWLLNTGVGYSLESRKPIVKIGIGIKF